MSIIVPIVVLFFVLLLLILRAIPNFVDKYDVVGMAKMLEPLVYAVVLIGSLIMILIDIV